MTWAVLRARLAAVPAWSRVSVGALAYLAGALLHARYVNVDPSRHDQLTYLEYAQVQAATAFGMPGNRLQMPALPTLLALFFPPGEPAAEGFGRAKLICIGVSVVCLLIVLFAAWRTLPTRDARTFGVLVAFFVFDFRAAYVQAELLSYTSMFVAFLLMMRAWRTPSPLLGAAVGAVSAASFFCKATGALGLYVFVGLLLLRSLFGVLRRGRPAADLSCAALAAGSFALCIYPYARTSKQLFGHYLHNINTTYVMWCDSWEQFLAWQAKDDLNLNGWRLPAEQVPSLRNYLASHGVLDIVWRELRGLAEVIGNCLVSHGYAPVVVLYLVGALLLCRQNPELRRRLFRRDRYAAAWFVVPYLLVYLLSFGWFGVITAGNRFALGLLMPGLFALLQAKVRAAREDDTAQLGARTWSWSDLDRTAWFLLCFELCVYWPWAIVTHYAGS